MRDKQLKMKIKDRRSLRQKQMRRRGNVKLNKVVKTLMMKMMMMDLI
jgi:hypothetical protein